MPTEQTTPRFVLTDAELSAGFKAIGQNPACVPPFEKLPKSRKSVAKALRGSDNRLSQAAEACLWILAEPKASLILRHWTENSASAMETRIIGGGKSGSETNYIQLSRPDDAHWDIALIGDFLAASDCLAGLTQPRPSGPTEPTETSFATPVALHMPALAVLGLLAAFLREARLRKIYAASQRRVFISAPEVTPEWIAAALGEMTQSVNLNQPIGRLALATGGALLDQTDRAAVKRGVDELMDQGLLGSDFKPTDLGMALIRHLDRGRSMTVVESTNCHDEGLAIEALFLHDGTEGRLVGICKSGSDGRIMQTTLAEIDEADSVKLIADTLAV